MMKTFTIPLAMVMYGHVTILADTLNKAIEMALSNNSPMPFWDGTEKSLQVNYNPKMRRSEDKMPNWAIGSVDVTGTREAVLAFSDRFITDDEACTITGRKYFARSFANEERSTFRREIEEKFNCNHNPEERSVNFLASFAWSAYSCLISGYPEQNPTECISLAEACVEDGVSVVIHTSEPGIGFEEEIACDKSGVFTNTEKDLTVYQCPQCGETAELASFEDPDDYECCECGHQGLVSKEDK